MWTQGKKVGDEVAIYVGGTFHGGLEAVRITGETPTQFILGDFSQKRIRKSDGRVIGGGYRTAEDMTEEVRLRIADRVKESRNRSRAREIINKLERMRQNEDGREWIVNNIGPLMPKEQETA